MRTTIIIACTLAVGGCERKPSAAPSTQASTTAPAQAPAAPPVPAPAAAPPPGQALTAAPSAAAAAPAPPQPGRSTEDDEVESAPGEPAPVASPRAAAVQGAADDGPPAVRRMLAGREVRGAGPIERGDYLIALDYREQRFGTYGWLANGDGRFWVVEHDEVVGGPLADGSPEMQKVTAAWAAAESDRHGAVMKSIAMLPHGCLDGCLFDVYQNGRYVGRRIEY